MSRNTVSIVTMFSLALIFFTLLCVSSVASYLSKSSPTFTDLLLEIAKPSAVVISGLWGALLSYYFFYKRQLTTIKRESFSTCARYDLFLKQLRQLRDPSVSALIMEYIGTLESPDLYVYDSSFIEFANLLSDCSRNERTRLLNLLATSITPKHQYKATVQCSKSGCPGQIGLSIKKGVNYKIPCPICGIRYLCYITGNDKIKCKKIPANSKRLTMTFFDEELDEYLTRIQANISVEDIKFSNCSPGFPGY